MQKEHTMLRQGGKNAKSLWIRLRRGLLALAAAASCTMPCFAAGSFGSSTFATGTISLINDVSAWITIIGPIAGGLVAGYFLIRRSMADETDGKMWMKRAITAVLCGVGVLLVGGFITILTGYYK